MTNEGNADLSGNVPEIRICSVGLEKIITKNEDLAVFVRLLTRSATGNSITQYTSHFRAPRQNGEMHIILVDNGRSSRLGHGEVLAIIQVHPVIPPSIAWLVRPWKPV